MGYITAEIDMIALSRNLKGGYRVIVNNGLINLSDNIINIQAGILWYYIYLSLVAADFEFEDRDQAKEYFELHISKIEIDETQRIINVQLSIEPLKT